MLQAEIAEFQSASETLNLRLNTITNEFFDKLSEEIHKLAKIVPIACSSKLRDLEGQLDVLQQCCQRNEKRQSQLEEVRDDATLSTQIKPGSTHNFSVGFSLQPSHLKNSDGK
eukprot:GHVN01034551.1.p2 GENE.GHVN01034551.1~~GHVN01034551.1.p2  ORF type:complete len:113 (+),score=15.62 GHVN01034551.1:231-569(+)